MEECYDQNVDYKELYLTMVRAAEQAIEALIEAQEECEKMYIKAADAACEDL